MLSAIIAVAVIGANQQAEPLFPRLFPNPTGQNALEYYVRAADLAHAMGLELWYPYLAETTNIPNRLEYEEEMASRTTKVLDLIRLGNRLPLTTPEGTEVLAAYSGIRDIAELAYQYARVQFVRGNPDKATDALLLVTEITDQLYGAGGFVQFMIGRVIDMFAMAGFHMAYTSISLDGADEILERLDVYDPSIAAGHWHREIAIIDAGIAKNDPQFDVQAWRSLRPKAQLLTSKLAEIFATEEIQWMRMASQLAVGEDKQEGESPPTPVSADKPATAVQKPLYSLPDAFSAQAFVRSTVANRARRRLLRLHARIAKYRWENGRLPDSLDVFEEAYRVDPANGQPYVYAKFTPAAYDLYSMGNSYYGVIRLMTYGSDMPKVTDGPPQR